MASQNQTVMLVSRSKSGFIKELQDAGLTVIHQTSISGAREYLMREGLPNGVVVSLEGLEEEGLDLCHELMIYAGLPVVIIGSSNPDPATVTAALEYSDSYLREKE